MDRRRGDEAGKDDENSRESQRENTSSPLSLQSASPTRQTPTTTGTPSRPQPHHPHRHPIPPPIHPPFHAYTPQLHPPVSTPETILQRRNLPLSTPLTIADLHQPGETSFAPHPGVSHRSSLGAEPGATSPIPTSGAVQPSTTAPTTANHPPGRRYSLKKRESNANLSASTPKPYIVKPAKSKSKSTDTATPIPAPSAEDLSDYVDTMTDSLTETLASLQSAAQAIRRVTIETERRAHARGNSAFAGGEEEEQEQEEDEGEDEEGMSSNQSAIVDLAKKF
ncbi:hypothetical protein ACHAO1_002359 [Botrytis cinerea]